MTETAGLAFVRSFQVLSVWPVRLFIVCVRPGGEVCCLHLGSSCRTPGFDPVLTFWRS
jgi:hypothetical protein